MEKLQQAIARARARREGEIGSLPEYDEVPRPDRRATLKRAGVAPPPAEINYTATRVITLDPMLLERNRVVAACPDHVSIETYRQLRTNVLAKMTQNQWQTLAITSPNENAGKSLTAVNLAISLAFDVNHTVLLADLDLKEPDVHRILGVDVQSGLVDILNGDARVENVLFNPSIQRLVVLPGRALGRYNSELLASPAMRRLLDDSTCRRCFVTMTPCCLRRWRTQRCSSSRMVGIRPTT